MVLAISKAFNLSAIIFNNIFYNIIFILKYFLYFYNVSNYFFIIERPRFKLRPHDSFAV